MNQWRAEPRIRVDSVLFDRINVAVGVCCKPGQLFDGQRNLLESFFDTNEPRIVVGLASGDSL